MKKLIIIITALRISLYLYPLILNVNANNSDIEYKKYIFSSKVLLNCRIFEISLAEDNHTEAINKYFKHLQIVSLNLKKLENSESDRSSENFYKALTNSFLENSPKFLKHCNVYIVKVNDQRSADKNDFNKLNFFSHKSLQLSGRTSFIFFINSEPNILFSTHLKNFSHKALIQKIPDSSGYKITYFCQYCHGGEPALVESFDLNEFLDFETFRNLNGHKLSLTAPPAPPLVSVISLNVKTVQNQTKLKIVGMQSAILKSVAKTLNFTYSVKKAGGGATGVKLRNNSWTGIMGEIERGDADIGLSVATSFERNKFFDFTTPVFNAFLILIAKKPTPIFNWKAIFYPFTNSAWVAILISILLAVAIHKILHNTSTRVKGGRKKRSENLFISKSIFLTIGALLEQGTRLKYSAISTRVFLAFWFMFAIVATCAYRSKLYLFLTFPNIVKPPGSFTDLSKSDYAYGLQSLGGIDYLFITQSPLPSIREIGDHMEIYTDRYSCMDRTVKQKFVCIIYKAYADYMIELRYWNIRSDIFISDYLTPPVGASWVLPKYSPFKNTLDKFLISQFEMGLVDKYIEDFTETDAKVFRNRAKLKRKLNGAMDDDIFDYNENYLRKEEKVKSLLLRNLYGAFFILAFGLSMSIVVFIIEKISKQTKFEHDLDIPLERRKRVKLGPVFKLLSRKVVEN